MADSILKCPLCCDETFESRSALVEHLANILGNITCPICSNKWSSLGHLIEHLTLDNCEPDDETETIICDVSPQDENSEIVTENSDCDFEELSQNKLGEFIEKENSNIHPFPIEENQIIEDESEMGRMYVELLSKQLTKPCLRTQELKLVKDNGVSRYIIMTSEDSNMSVGSTVVTKQNTDGTISLTTVKDMKTETDSDTVITQDNDYEDTQEEIYSCNTCGISFTSVVDHIQNYHNDQDVVVEEPLEEDGSDSMPSMCYEPLPTEELSPDKHTRRMITDTGDIVETPVTMDIPVSMDASPPSVKAEVKEEAAERACPAPARTGRVRVGAPRDTVVVAPSTDSTNGPYHKVVVKEMRTTSGQMVKVYHCMSCGIYVSALDEFKGHPCKVLESDAQTSKIFKYRCPHCPVSYENSKSLCAHMKAHKPKVTIEPPPPLTSFECETCTTVFQTNKSLKLHKRMHDPVKSRPLLPPVGSPEGSEVNHDKFLCPVCLKLIPTDYRTIHQNSHKNTDRFNCDVCNKKFTSNEYLEMHMTVHSIDKVVINKQDKSLPYTCVYCDRRFARPHEKVKHERIHTGEKPHRCDICGKSFRVSYCLTLHMRTHTGARPYACPHCDKRFKAHSVYNHHLLTHSEVRAYKCPYCPKAFKTSVQLAGHKNSHTKPFSCQHCNRPFASLYAVRVHTETHARQNNLRYSCTLCGASYARGFALRDHLRQVHKQEMAKAEGNKVTKIKEDEWIICTTDGDGANVPTVIEITKELPPEVQLMQA